MVFSLRIPWQSESNKCLLCEEIASAVCKEENNLKTTLDSTLNDGDIKRVAPIVSYGCLSQGIRLNMINAIIVILPAMAKPVGYPIRFSASPMAVEPAIIPR